MKKYSYITVLSTEKYLEGALVLAESLKKTGTKYPLSILITDDISKDVEETLKKFDFKIIRKSKISIPESIKIKNEHGSFSHWTNTFDKLLLFELTEFDKLVYLDSDMYVRKNIDELFEKKNMSATIDRRYGPIFSEDWVKLTSGLMVIEPKKNVINRFMELISSIEDKRVQIGDQDILQEYDLNWCLKEELHLDVKYNMFFPHTDYFTHYCNYSLDDICVIHFIYTQKPFYFSKEHVEDYMNYIEGFKKNNYEKYKLDPLKKYISCGNDDEKEIIKEYFELLEDIRVRQ